MFAIQQAYKSVLAYAEKLVSNDECNYGLIKSWVWYKTLAFRWKKLYNYLVNSSRVVEGQALWNYSNPPLRGKVLIPTAILPQDGKVLHELTKGLFFV